MSYVPDGRTDESYNQKYLNGDNKEFLQGFDWCVEMAVDNFFDNEMDYLQDEDSYLGHLLSEELPDNMKKEYEMEYVFNVQNMGETETRTRKIETYADLIRMTMLQWIEMERDMLITSMIDGMDDDEYAEIRAKVDGQSETED